MTWTPPTQNMDDSALTNLVGHRIYFRLQSEGSPGIYSNFVEVGTISTATLTGLETGQSYCVAVTAINSDFAESDFSGEACGFTTAAPVPEITEDKAGAGCFVATAAFESPMHPYVSSLRAFREAYLRPFGSGRAFIRWYERVGPPLAAALDKHSGWKPAVRLALWPAVGVSVVMLSTTGTQKLGILLALGMAVAFGVAGIRRRWAR